MRRRDNKAKSTRKVRWDRIFLVIILPLILVIGLIAIFTKNEPAAQASESFEMTTKTVVIEPSEAPTESIPSRKISPVMLGHDISKHNGEISMDTLGDFVLIKGTEGVDYVDPMFETNIQNALGDNKLCGVYHFARPDTNCAIDEADDFIQTVRPYLGKVMLVLDWEVESEISNTEWVTAWMWRVYTVTGVKPVLYTSASAAQDYDWRGISEVFELWVACYPNMDSSDLPDKMDIPYDISSWKTIIWQYSPADNLDKNICSLDASDWLTRCEVASFDVTLPGEDIFEAYN